MSGSRASWVNTTHDWAAAVDTDHLDLVRRSPGEFAPGGVEHLVLEVVAYAADEAESRGAGRCSITLHADGSVSVQDDGRGTDTRVDEHGEVVKKPVMTTKDLRFFDAPDAEQLPDGWPRRGVSVVAALSDHLVHTNRRLNGSWAQHYEHGIPVTGLEPVETSGSTGTTVTFLPNASVSMLGPLDAARLGRLCSSWPVLDTAVDDQRGKEKPR